MSIAADIRDLEHCIAELERERDEAKAALIEWCGNAGYATGHGDTTADIVREIREQAQTQLAQAREDTARLELARELVVRALREAQGSRPRAARELGIRGGQMIRELHDSRATSPKRAFRHYYRGWNAALARVEQLLLGPDAAREAQEGGE